MPFFNFLWWHSRRWISPRLQQTATHSRFCFTYLPSCLPFPILLWSRAVVLPSFLSSFPSFFLPFQICINIFNILLKYSHAHQDTQLDSLDSSTVVLLCEWVLLSWELAGKQDVLFPKIMVVTNYIAQQWSHSRVVTSSGGLVTQLPILSSSTGMWPYRTVRSLRHSRLLLSFLNFCFLSYNSLQAFDL